MPRFTRTITATPADIDELGHVNNAVWVRWIQDVAVAHWAAVADPAHVDAYVWVVTRHEIDYRGNVAAGERVTAETWVPEAPRGARFDRHMRFTGADGRVKVEAKTTWAIVERASGKLIRVPREVAVPFLAD
ncbi:acyl-CoA thioesterase [Sphingomonas japonica]|uniref:Acyl-CoA thioester hydrolase n=1 Tax=Sphingomonas japonica TaxID=511662 RepID=A0ABX0TYK2_9SPHN|nr:acyl-CoA thioesterase [Sphingomonas japonica]NIJ23401.1 acyl-CoA thioester hydrolase [Sphingomonas japonica]